MRLHSRIEFLKKDRDGNIEPQSNSEAEAWACYLRLLRRVEHLERTKIEAGDIVEINAEGRFAEVSSIGEEGRVYFKGGYGAGSWPDLLTVRARRNVNSLDAELMRKKARNCAAQTAPIGEWSELKHRELAKYETKNHIDEEDINRIEQVINSARDEKSIQKHIEETLRLSRLCWAEKSSTAYHKSDLVQSTFRTFSSVTLTLWGSIGY